MTSLIGSMSTAASCIKIASSGDCPCIAPQIVGGTARYTAGAMRFRMSIQMSFASVVAQTMGVQFSRIAKLPSLYSGCTRFALISGRSVLLMAMSHRRAVKCF